jgi:hypothetical protein
MVPNDDYINLQYWVIEIIWHFKKHSGILTNIILFLLSPFPQKAHPAGCAFHKKKVVLPAGHQQFYWSLRSFETGKG